MPVPASVRKASKSFYAALNQMLRGDASQMRAVWSRTTAATTMRLIGGRERGWSKVEGPWAQVASLCTGGSVKLRDARIHATRDMAVESGIESGTMTMAGETVAIEHRVTNVYVRDGREWKILHHHTDLSPEMIAVMKRLPSGNA
jgi:ketosteroid isomerase-like protein